MAVELKKAACLSGYPALRSCRVRCVHSWEPVGCGAECALWTGPVAVDFGDDLPVPARSPPPPTRWPAHALSLSPLPQRLRGGHASPAAGVWVLQ